MSTKKLSKTVIEGGRSKSSSYLRKKANISQRNSEKAYCLRSKNDVEFADEIFIKDEKPVYKDFDDKLRPMYRWLNAQVGRPWNDVHSEAMSKFDSRTTAGRHILYDHLISSVEIGKDFTYQKRNYSNKLDEFSSYYKNDFYVDDSGILRQKTYISRDRSKTPKFNTQNICNWLSCRVVGKVGTRLFWFVISNKNKKRSTNCAWKTEWKNNYYNSGLKYYCSSQDAIYSNDGKWQIIGYKNSWIESKPIFRQDKKLNNKDIIFWNSLPEYYQNEILKQSPTYSKI